MNLGFSNVSFLLMAAQSSHKQSCVGQYFPVGGGTVSCVDRDGVPTSKGLERRVWQARINSPKVVGWFWAGCGVFPVYADLLLQLVRILLVSIVLLPAFAVRLVPDMCTLCFRRRG
ncbi:uncharacterized protein BJX67DRAFT_148735 [Aspergillus lucknowensis]|uniref:Uncharacterized protein n=1 Tax=Aspergillus lucknowensis TaxID=176173 RepID=A0ABR4LNQ1_9EURO